MKNIHILPTDKPSRLHFTEFFWKLVFTPKYEKLDGVNIYITYSNANINENDYIITKDVKLVQASYLLSKDLEGASKVILTTDQDLIKDGVQSIPDEFLQWFVKNPSCKWVELDIETELDAYYRNGIGGAKPIKIIIPKEEPKMIECYFTPRKDTSSATICSNCGQEKFMHTIGSGIKVSKSVIITKEEPKQRLEKYSERFDNKDNEIVDGIFNPYTWGKRLVDDEPKQEKIDFVYWLMDNCELITDSETQENVLWRYDSEDYTVEGLFKVFVDFINPNAIKITKEEPKQVCENCKREISKWGCACGKQVEPKQETLQEVAERYSANELSQLGFINGAKWQEQQTIEEVFEWLTTNNYLTDLKETLIENFKNR